MVSVSHSSALLALLAAASAVMAQAGQYVTLADWKKSVYYKEALDKGFLPSSAPVPAATKKNTGEFSMDTNVVAEEKKRFEQAVSTVAELQRLHPHATFSMDTPFALMSHDEFLAYVNRFNIGPEKNPMHSASNSDRAADGGPKTGAGADGGLKTGAGNATSGGADGGPKTGAAAAGEFVDWQEKGCVTPVKDQMQCGACWAFSAAAAMESGLCVRTGGARLPNLSDQQLISCDNQGQSEGCGGGYSSYTMDWIAQSRKGRMCTLESYPFASSDGNVPSCRHGSCTEVDIGVTGFDAIRKDPSKLEDAVRARPVSVFLYSGSNAFQFYKGGILTGGSCDKTGAHSALAVGFGEENGLPYWRVKNQWGVNWGEGGYVRIQRRFSGDDEGACGVELYASFPTFGDSVTAAPATAAPATDAPTPKPTLAATPAPTPAATPAPTPAATPAAKPAVTPASTEAPPTRTPAPTAAQTPAPTMATTKTPVSAKTPTPAATVSTESPAAAETPAPASTVEPTEAPAPAPAQTDAPTKMPSTPVQPSPFVAPAVDDPNQGVKLPATPAAATGAACAVPLQDDVEFLGNDISSTRAASAADCSVQCQKRAGCGAFTFSVSQGSTCWLKSRVGLAVPTKGAVSGSFHDDSKATNQNTPLEVGYDYPGNDLREVRAGKASKCYDLCARETGCHAFTWSNWNGGTCYLKSRKSAAAVYTAPGAQKLKSAIVYKCQQPRVNTDITGQDIGNAPAQSPDACCALCHGFKGCAGFTWNTYNAGTCWFKAGAANMVAKTGTVAASI